MSRTCRSTRAVAEVAEAEQSRVIAQLIDGGDRAIALRLAQCQFDRRDRQPGWPYRCGSAGCYACRRTAMLRWWRGFRDWVGAADSSLALLPLGGDPFLFVRRLRRSLRDCRDRAARREPNWRAVTMGGFASGHGLQLLVRHVGIERDEVASVFEQQRRWLHAAWQDIGEAEPTTWVGTDHAAALALRRRATEPMRIVIPARRMVSVPDGTGDEDGKV